MAIRRKKATVEEIPEYPRIEYAMPTFEQGYYTDGDGTRYPVEELLAQALREGGVAYDIPIAFIDMSRMPWRMDNFNDFCRHMERVMSLDPDFPIIFDDEGYICDGWHRLARAILAGETMIKAYRLKNMPKLGEKK